MIIRKFSGFLGSLLLLFAIAIHLHVYAGINNPIPLTANWDSSNCTASLNIDGSASSDYGIAQGDTVTLTISNNASIVMDYSINSASPVPIANGDTSASLSPSSQSQINISVTPDPSDVILPCTQATAGTFTIIPGSATLTCTTDSGNWDITGTYTDVVSQASLFEATTSQKTYSAGSGTIDSSFAAGSSPTSFYFYDGNSSGARLLAIANCQAPATSAAANNTGTTSPTASPTASPTSLQSLPNPVQNATSTTYVPIVKTQIQYNKVGSKILYSLLGLVILIILIRVFLTFMRHKIRSPKQFIKYFKLDTKHTMRNLKKKLWD